MPTYTITADQLASIKASRLQHLDNGDEAAADALGWVLTAEPSGWGPIETAPSEMPRAYLVANASGQVAPHIDGVIHNVAGSAWDWNYGESITSWQPLPQPPEA